MAASGGGEGPAHGSPLEPPGSLWLLLGAHLPFPNLKHSGLPRASACCLHSCPWLLHAVLLTVLGAGCFCLFLIFPTPQGSEERDLGLFWPLLCLQHIVSSRKYCSKWNGKPAARGAGGFSCFETSGVGFVTPLLWLG